MNIVNHNITLIVFLFIFVFISYDLSASESSLYYVRYDYKTRNGLLVESNLLMIPAKEEFRIKSFMKYRITGKALVSEKSDPLSAAKQDALKNILQSFGIKSIHNKSISDQTNHNEETVLSYEGLIKTPYYILNQGFTDNSNHYEVEMDIFFSPITYPSDWSFNYFKKKLYDILHNMISVFL